MLSILHLRDTPCRVKPHQIERSPASKTLTRALGLARERQPLALDVILCWLIYIYLNKRLLVYSLAISRKQDYGYSDLQMMKLPVAKLKTIQAIMTVTKTDYFLSFDTEIQGVVDAHLLSPLQM